MVNVSIRVVNRKLTLHQCLEANIFNLVPYVAHMELLPVSSDIKCEAEFLISKLFDHRITVKRNVWYKLLSTGTGKLKQKQELLTYIYCAI